MRGYSWLLERIGSGRRPVRRQATKSRPAPHWRPRLELLEDRRLLSAGGLDPTFGTGGLADPATTIHGIAAAEAVYSNAQAATAGDIVAAGYIFPSNRQWQLGLVRFTANGQMDTSFGSKGEVITSFKSYAYSEANAVAIQGDGKILAMGTAFPNSATGPGTDFVVTRYNVNGSLDLTFGSKGTVITNLSGSPTSGSNDYARAGFFQPDGKIVVAGITTTNYPYGNDIGLARYNSNGSLDTTFDGSGKVVTSHTAIPISVVNPPGTILLTQVEAAVPQADGSILVSGYVVVTTSSPPYSYEAFVACYTPQGTLDPGFGKGGFVALPAQQQPYSPDGPRGEIAVEPNGEIVVTGFNQLALLHADGSFDTSFGSGGIAPNGAGPVAVEPNGDIVTYAYSGDQVNRYLLTNGTLDPTFGSGGTATPVSFINALVIQPDGKIDVADGYEIARLLPAEPQIASFKADTNPDGSVTLTTAGVTALHPGSTVTQVSYYVDSNGDGVLDAGDALLTGTLTQSTGTWTLTFSTTTAGLAPGTYTLFVQAQDNFGALSDPLSLTLQVM